MWQANKTSWRIICVTAALVVLAWPSEQSRSLGMKAVNWLADPREMLPTLPPPLAMGLDDDADAVTAHDQQERTYYDYYNRSTLNRWRMELKDATDPWDVSTGRQMVAALAVFGALAAWRANTQGLGTGG
jgi:hypothetical protein